MNIIVTGSTKGIGRETAKLLIQQGHNVLINGRNEDQLKDQLLSLDSSKVIGIAADATNKSGIESIIDLATKKWSQIDGIILNAGHSMRGSFKDTDTAVWEQMYVSNLLGPVRFIQSTLPLLRESRAKVMFISSQGSLFGFPNVIPYSVFKSALIPLTEGLINEEPLVKWSIFFPGFTQNDKDKIIMDSRGHWVRHERKASFTQEKTAKAIVKAFYKKKVYNIMGLQGKILFRLSRIAPGLLFLYTKRKGAKFHSEVK
ncbi:SDR family NAD(P)-dependent oxidoreductase [Spirochaeta cellobiosiphila]|uniref:SDR family NAD(P)-dependent oxidoreductase n=1 Tax=Spirochaeta cellobiosiphila TaxID=504483 RepID=UPI00040DBF5A|nr:SDR family oxidoreductase [Spirochaeta cellobiosiphila]